MSNSPSIKWRQGHVLPEFVAKTNKLFHSETPDTTLVVIISHDCDLANIQETHLEVIVGRRVEKSDGNLTHTKNPRKLHIEYKYAGKPIIIELLADKKTKLLKQELYNYQPSNDFQLEPKDLNILQRWLAVRYRRSAFPSSFNIRLKDAGLDTQISNILRPHGSFIPAIFFDVDEGENIERLDPDDSYTLAIIILYIADEDNEKALEAATQVKEKIEKIFKEELKTKHGNQWKYIELKDCSIMSDEALTFRQSTMLRQWRLEHMSLREDPVQPVLEH